MFIGGRMNRRKFLSKGSSLTGAAMALPAAVRGAVAFQQFKIGMAGAAWLTADPSTKTYWEACRDIASLGIRATEADNGQALLDTAYGKDPAEFKRESAKYRMSLIGVYQGLRLHEKDKLAEMRAKIAQVAKFLKLVDAEYIALGWDVPPPVDGRAFQRTPTDVKTAIKAIGELAKVSEQEAGFPLGYHPERDQSKEVILHTLDSINVRFIADVGHLAAVGLDPVETIKKYASRHYASHWKDFDPKLPSPAFYGSDAKGDFTVMGRGIVNFRALADLYEKLGFNGWVIIELDRPDQKSGFLEDAREMKEYVTRKLKLEIYGGQS
jgi:sugar phosphate isomerase/epimerase